MTDEKFRIITCPKCFKPSFFSGGKCGYCGLEMKKDKTTKEFTLRMNADNEVLIDEDSANKTT